MQVKRAILRWAKQAATGAQRAGERHEGETELNVEKGD